MLTVIYLFHFLPGHDRLNKFQGTEILKHRSSSFLAFIEDPHVHSSSCYGCV